MLTYACSAHRFEQEFLNTVFRELEEQLAIARAEREETQSRAERERRASLKRARELEEVISAQPIAATPLLPPHLRHPIHATPLPPRHVRHPTPATLPHPPLRHPTYAPHPAARRRSPPRRALSLAHCAPLSLRRCGRKTGRLSRCARSATRRRCAP